MTTKDEALRKWQDALAVIDEAQAQPAPTPEMPPLPEIDPAQCIPYESIRYIAGFSEDFVKQYAQAYARAAIELHAKRGSEAPQLVDLCKELDRLAPVISGSVINAYPEHREPVLALLSAARPALAQRSAEPALIAQIADLDARATEYAALNDRQAVRIAALTEAASLGLEALEKAHIVGGQSLCDEATASLSAALQQQPKEGGE